MAVDIHREIHQGLDEVTADRREFIRKAFHILPKLDRPRILDIGCGRGGPTLELARLSGGEVIGVDIDAQALDELAARAAVEGLSEHIRVRNCSMSAMDFEEESFDVIWAEASLHVVGFEEGLDAWRRFLAAEGFLVIHEMAWLRPDPPAEVVAHWRSIFPGIRTVDEYAAEIPRHGYDLMSDFALPEEFWWANYFRPLELRIKALREKYRGDHAALAVFRTQEREVDLYRKYRAWYGSAYLVMQKQSA